MTKTYDDSVLMSVTGVNQVFDVGDEKVTVLTDINFDIKANSFNIIYGSSGSGKSTLLDILAGLKAPSSGQVIVGGKDIYALSPDELAAHRANKVGFVHQANYWIKSLNVLDNVTVPLFFLGYTKKEGLKMAMQALDYVGMASYAKKSPIMLSGGEQQRIGMARALANSPLLIIADEPTGNLDSENSRNIMKLLIDSQAVFRRTVIVVTHNMGYITLADHLLKIEDGRVLDVAPDKTSAQIKTLMNEVEQEIKQNKELKRHATAKL
ncbi:ABC transporter ATP-binding protein [Candidatus Saccharibacteria bacterium]|nr:MAG: ABC transporter ATP-binding protein [Candidatus Saccharibacteria bacterium]